MKIIPTMAMAASLMLIAGLSGGANAQTAKPEAKAAAQAAENTTPATEGEVKKIDKETGKVTIKHGEIKNLDMPGMTMVFTAKDKSMLDKVQAGSKVKFHASADNGGLWLTDIQLAK